MRLWFTRIYVDTKGNTLVEAFFHKVLIRHRIQPKNGPQSGRIIWIDCTITGQIDWINISSLTSKTRAHLSNTFSRCTHHPTRHAPVDNTSSTMQKGGMVNYFSLFRSAHQQHEKNRLVGFWIKSLLVSGLIPCCHK